MSLIKIYKHKEIVKSFGIVSWFYFSILLFCSIMLLNIEYLFVFFFYSFVLWFLYSLIRIRFKRYCYALLYMNSNYYRYSFQTDSTFFSSSNASGRSNWVLFALFKQGRQLYSVALSNTQKKKQQKASPPPKKNNNKKNKKKKQQQ